MTIPIEDKKDNVETALLDETMAVTPTRYPTSELKQFWVVLKRTLLFSRRDWVSNFSPSIRRTNARLRNIIFRRNNLITVSFMKT